MMKLSGNRELYARDPRDAVILYALKNHKTIMDTNELLDANKMLALGVQA